MRALKRRSDTRVLSAWDAGEAGAAMRPVEDRGDDPRVGRAHRGADARPLQESIDSTVDDPTPAAPVRSHISGTPTLDRAIEDEALHTTRVATLLALPILFLALLLILRAPLAALVTTAFGGVVAFSGFGAMTIVGKAFNVDAIGIALTSRDGARARNRAWR